MSRFYTVQETAYVLGFSTNSIYKFLDQNRLRGSRGKSKQGRFRIAHSAIEEFLGARISEAVIDQALAEYYRLRVPDPQAPTPRLSPSHPPTQSLSQTPALPLTLTRLMLIVCLVLVILDIIITPQASWANLGIRLIIITQVVLLSYQFGGLTLNPNR